LSSSKPSLKGKIGTRPTNDATIEESKGDSGRRHH
jgi:hypothetical protein